MVMWRFRTGSSWRDLRAEYGSWSTVYDRFRSWATAGVLARLAACAGEPACPSGPAGALAEWLHRLIAFTASFRGLAMLLGAHQDTTLEERHAALYAAAQLLLNDCC
jgi:transposase